MCPAAICQKIDRITTRWPWHTRDVTVNNILLRDFGIYFIMIYYLSLLSQDMSYRIGVR
jgi:hypothetical protein